MLSRFNPLCVHGLPECANYHQKMTHRRFEVFKSQDQEKGYFDVAFEIGEKTLYANNYVLTPVSETLAAMCSERWREKGEIIKIEEYSYDNFYQFLCFLYTGYCDLNEENIFQLTDMAEFYGVEYFKDFSDSFLTKMMKLEIENIEQMFDFASKYSLEGFLLSIKEFSQRHLMKILANKKFMTFKKPFIAFLYDRKKSDFHFTRAQECDSFEHLYKWAEYQVMERAAKEDQAIILESTINEEISDILPDINFGYMYPEFLLEFVVAKGFFVSADQLTQLYKNSRTDKEENLFKNIYNLAEKQELKKQSLEPKNDFNLFECVKAELAEIIRSVKFYKMSKEFLSDFIVPKGILTEEQASHVFDVRVELKIRSEVVAAVVVKDKFGIIRGGERTYQASLSRSSNLVFCFPKLNVRIPNSYPSTVTKLKGAEWYLCMNQDEILAVKHFSMTKNSDYLIGEMEGRPLHERISFRDFSLTVSYNNVFKP